MNKYLRQFCLIIVTILSCLFVYLRQSYVLSEELSPYNSETRELPIVSGFNIMDTLSMLYHDLHVGPIGISPSYQIKETFDDNVFFSSADEVSDFYTSHLAGIELASPLSDFSRTYLNYNAEIYDYMRLDEQNHINQSVKAAFDFRFANDFNFSVSDQLSKREIPGIVNRRFVGNIEEVPTEDFALETFVAKREFIINLASFDLDLPDFFPNLDSSIHYANRDVSYEEKEFEDSDYNTDIIRTLANYNYPFLPIQISSGFVYTVQRYDLNENNDSIRKNIPFDITWNITPKNAVYLNTEYRISDYNSNSTLEDFKGLTTVLGDRYAINPVSSIEIHGERSIRELRASDNNAYLYLAIGIRYTITHDRFDAFIDVGYSKLKFLEENEAFGITEKIDGVNVDLNVRYSPQEWWFAEFNYNYDFNNDNIDFGDFSRNTLSLAAGLNF